MGKQCAHDRPHVREAAFTRFRSKDLLSKRTSTTMASQSSAMQPAASSSTNAGNASLSDNVNAASASGTGDASSSTAGPGAQPGRSGMGNPPDMHLDTTTGKWMFEDPQTGQEFEWNEAANAWLPVVEDDLIKQQQAAYSVQGVDETVSRPL